MKMRTVRRAIIILCLMCILAACARESAAAEVSPAADYGVTCAAPAPAGPDWLERSEECLRIISDCLGRSKSLLSSYGILSPGSGTSSAG